MPICTIANLSLRYNYYLWRGYTKKEAFYNASFFVYASRFALADATRSINKKSHLLCKWLFKQTPKKLLNRLGTHAQNTQ